MPEQYKAAVPMSERREGWVYDADSGVLMGLASDEMKRRFPMGAVFRETFAGCPHRVIIHKKPVEPVAEVPAILIPTVFL